MISASDGATTTALAPFTLTVPSADVVAVKTQTEYSDDLEDEAATGFWLTWFEELLGAWRALMSG